MSGNPPDKTRVTPANLAVAVAVVLAVQLMALAITLQNLPTYSSVVGSGGSSFSPLGSTPAGSAGNALLLVLIVFVSTLGLVFLVRRKMVFSFKALIFGSLALSSFLLTLITVDSVIYPYVPLDLELAIDVTVSLAVVFAIGLTIFVRNYPVLSTAIIAFVGAEVGSFFASTLPLLTALMLPIVFSAYDVYAVFKGPLKQLIGLAPGIALTGMSVKAGEFTLGLGDVVFYSMLPSLALFYVSLPVSLAVVAAVDLGVLATLYLLSRSRLLPGLPIPMLLGVAVLTVALYA
jgi:Presenilin